MITNEQLKARQLGIGGSDMPIILGLSSFLTPYQLYLQKTGINDLSGEETPLQYWGNQLESIVRDEFAKRNNVVVETPDTITSPFYDFMIGNIDGYIPELNAILEIKCSHQFMASEWGESGSDIIPMSYLVQVAWYCILKNADCAYIAVLIGGNDYREFKYERDFVLEDTLIKAAKVFWNCVQTKTPPEPVNQVDLRLMYPKHDPEKTVVAKPEIADQLCTLADTRFKIKTLSEIEDKSKFNIMQFMQDAEVLVDEYDKPIVTWKANKRGSRTFLMKGM